MRKLFSCFLLLSLLLGCHKGYVALFQAGSSEPMQIFPYPVTSLPQADQLALSQGIPIQNQTELARLMEDFLS